MKKITFIFLFTAITVYAQCNTAISSGHKHTILIKNNGTIHAWGYGSSGWGALGLNSYLDITNPTQVGVLTNWSKLFSGSYNSFIIKTDGTLWASGDNEDGQLGDGTYGSGNVSNVFKQVGSSSNWKTISASTDHTLGIKNDGTLWAWGSNQQGKLGDGTYTNKYIPTQIGTASNWKEITSGLQYSVAIKTDGTLWAWGLNNVVFNNPTPTQIGIANDWKVISSDSAGLHTLAIKNNGTLYVFGTTWSGGNGALGLGSTIFVANDPTKIGTDSDWQSISAGFNNSFAIKENGTLWGWGQNDLGQLGDGTQVDKLIPTQIGIESNWIMVSAGQRHTVALKNNGDLYTWGDNTHAQLGNGNYTSTITPLFINSCILSNEEFEKPKTIFYPNPTKGIINIKCENLIKILIYDNLGKKIKEFEPKPQIDLSDISKGIYFIKLISDNEIFMNKVVIE